MTFYRFDIVSYEDGPRIFLSKYSLIRETPKGHWIGSSGKGLKTKERWVSKTSRKRFAYPSIEEAKTSFTARTTRRIKILESQAWRCREALTKFNSGNYITNTY